MSLRRHIHNYLGKETNIYYDGGWGKVAGTERKNGETFPNFLQSSKPILKGEF